MPEIAETSESPPLVWPPKAAKWWRTFRVLGSGLFLLWLAPSVACADVITYLQTTWDGDFGAYRWDYSITPSTDIGNNDYYEIMDMYDIVGGLVEWAGEPYEDPNEKQWTTTYTYSSVRWQKSKGISKKNNEYAYFSYYSDFGAPGELVPWYRNGQYQGDVVGATPEPGTFILVALGLGAGLAGKLRRRREDK